MLVWVVDSKLLPFSSPCYPFPSLQVCLGVILMAFSDCLVSLSSTWYWWILRYGGNEWFFFHKATWSELPGIWTAKDAHGHIAVCTQCVSVWGWSFTATMEWGRVCISLSGTGNRKPPVLKWVNQDLSEKGRFLLRRESRKPGEISHTVTNCYKVWWRNIGGTHPSASSGPAAFESCNNESHLSPISPFSHIIPPLLLRLRPLLAPSLGLML